MNRSRSGVALLCGVVAATAVACGTGGTSGSGSNGTLQTGPGVNASAKTINLGVLTPLSGPAAIIGKYLAAGQADYFKNLDATGGVSGWQVNLTTLDNKYPDAQTQVQDYNQIINNVLFLAQSLGSPTTQAIEQLAENAHVLIGTAAQDSAFVTHDINAVIGTPYAVDMANAMYYVSQHMSGAKVGLIYQNDAYGQDGLKGYTAGMQAFGLTSVQQATYAATDTSFASQVLAMKSAGATVVALTAIPTAAATIIGTGATLGYHPQWILQAPAWSEFLMTSTGVASGAPTPVEPALVGAWVLGYEAQWGDTSVPGMSQFLSVQQKYSPMQVPDGYYMYGYCLAEVEQQIIAKALGNNDLTRNGILQAKLNLGHVSFGGLLPDLTYSASLGPADRQTGIYQVDLSTPGFLKQIQPYFESSAAMSMTFGS